MIPQIEVAFDGWETPITLIKVTQSIVDYQNVETEEAFTFKGVIQPLGPKELVIKPIGERSWEWLQIHTRIEIGLDNGDKIRYNGKKYKVMLQNNYVLNNYFEYHLVADYE